MASLQEIKNRLHSISTTKKITKAMQLVATAKLQRVNSNLSSIKEYYSSVNEMFEDLSANISNMSKLFPINESKSHLYIVINVHICCKETWSLYLAIQMIHPLEVWIPPHMNLCLQKEMVCKQYWLYY